MAGRFTLGKRSLANLVGVDPDLARLVRAVFDDPDLDVDHAIVEGVRTDARQAALLADPRKVTDVAFSKHQIQASGYGDAIDFMAVGDLDGDGDVDAQDVDRTWDPVLYTRIASFYKKHAARLRIGIKWGGDFKRRNGKPFFDGPHIERDHARDGKSLTLDVANDPDVIYTGTDTTFRLSVTEVDSDSGIAEAVDMTGWVVEAWLKTLAGVDVLELTSGDPTQIETIDAAGGVFDLHFAAAATADLEAGRRRLMIRGTEDTGELRMIDDREVVVKTGPE